MSVIEDVRQIVQDFITPDLKALLVRVDALEKKIDSMDKRNEANHQEQLAAIRALADFNSLALRVTRIEAKQETQQQ